MEETSGRDKVSFFHLDAAITVVQQGDSTVRHKERLQLFPFWDFSMAEGRCDLGGFPGCVI